MEALEEAEHTEDRLETAELETPQTLLHLKVTMVEMGLALRGLLPLVAEVHLPLVKMVNQAVLVVMAVTEQHRQLAVRQ